MMNLTRKILVGAGAVASIFVGGWPAVAHDSTIRHVHVTNSMEPDFEWFYILWHQDIPYASAPDTTPHLLSLDVYSMDPAPTNAPVVVYVHGGGGTRGDKAWPRDIGVKPVFFARQLGMVFVSVNYRLGDAGRFPNAQQDVANSVAWVHDNISQYGGDPNRIVLGGHSAGAGLVARVAGSDAFLKNAGKDLSVLKGAFTIDGGNFDDLSRSVSNGTYVPPWLFLHIGDFGVGQAAGAPGGSERNATAMASELRRAGLRADVAELIGKDHFQASVDIGKYGDPATLAVQRFMESVVGAGLTTEPTSQSRSER